MKVSSCGDNIKYIANDNKVMVATECGNVRIEYLYNLMVYRISKTDGTEFNGEEYLKTSSNQEKYYPIEDIVDQLINMFTYLQNNIESIMFDKYYYSYSESKKSIIIEPIFLKTEGVEVFIPDGYYNELRLTKHKVGIKK